MTSGWSKASKLPTLALPSSCCGGNKQHLYFCQQMYKYISIRNYISIWNYCELDRKTNVARTVWAIHNCILCSMVNKQRSWCDCGNFKIFLSVDALKCFHFQLKLHLHLCKQSRRQCELVKIWRRRAVKPWAPRPSPTQSSTEKNTTESIILVADADDDDVFLVMDPVFFNPFDDENYNGVSETNSCSCCLRLSGTQRLGVPCLCNRNVFWNLKTWQHLMMDPWQVLKRGWWVLTTVFERKICHSSVSLFLCAQIYSSGRWLGCWRIWKKADKEHSIIIH